MKALIPAASCLAAVLASATIAADAQRAWTFDQDPPKTAPAGYLFTSMRQPNAGRWTIERQGAQGHLTHHADASAMGYAMALVTEPATDNVALSTRLRFAGAIKSGGLVWRASDGQNCYALVLDLVARDLRLYRVRGGVRVQLDVEDDLELDPQAWHSLKVVHVDSEIRVSLGGIGVFEEQDRRYERSAGPVRVGVLAAGAAEVWFDDLHVDPKKEHK